MPNHCDADMTITGPADVLGEFLAKYVTECDGTVLSLDAIRPYPAKYRGLDRIAREYEEQHPEHPWQGRPKDGFNSGGYEWCLKNWRAYCRKCEKIKLRKVNNKNAEAAV